MHFKIQGDYYVHNITFYYIVHIHLPLYSYIHVQVLIEFIILSTSTCIYLTSITVLHPGSHNININAAAIQSHSPASPVVALSTAGIALLLP